MSTSVTTLVSHEAVSENQATITPSYPSGYEETSFFDLASIRAILWRQRWILLTVTGAVLLAGLVLTMLMTPIYQANASVRIDPQNAEIIEGQDLVDPYVASNEMLRYLETLLAVVQSNSLALKVVDDLKLADNPVVVGEAAKSGPPAGMSQEAWNDRRRQMAANVLQGSVDASNPINTRIIQITFRSEDAALAARIANSYAENFIADNVSRSVDANVYAQEFLEQEITKTRNELRDAELRAIEYARANRIIGQLPSDTYGMDIGTAETLTVTELNDTAKQLSEARADRIAAEQRWRSIANVPASQLPEVRDNTSIDTMKSRVATLNAELADLRQRYRDEHPSVQGRLAEIATLNRQIAAASEEVKRSIRDEYEAAQGRETALAGTVRQISSETLDEQDRRVQYNLMAREAAAAREQLRTLLQRFNQISSAGNLRRNDATMLDPAQVPGAPFSPNLFTNMFLALVAGLGLAVGIAVLREVFDDRLRSLEDVERRLKVPALGQTPYVSHQIGDELGSMFSPISEAYSSIRATLDFALPKSDTHIVQFTSSQPAEGKTTSAIALATKFASLGHRVLLVDLDLRRPSVGKSMRLDTPKVGVVDVLHGRAALADVAVRGDVDNLDVLLVGPIPQNPVEILSSGLLPEFFNKHRKDYDYIVIDSSPVLGIADAPLLSRFVDAVVFVAEANRVHYNQVRQSIRRLRDVNANIVGVMLTKFRALEAGKDHNYQYLYYAYGDN